MPVCPVCKTEQKKRKNDACPNCGTRIEIHDGLWYHLGSGSPSLRIVRHLEKRVTESVNRGRERKIIFTIPEKSAQFKRELVTASRYIDQAGGDVDLVIETLDILFTHKRFSWRSWTSLIGMRDFSLALAIAKANRDQVAAKNTASSTAYQTVMQKENIFA